jgi:hypothetical protein
MKKQQQQPMVLAYCRFSSARQAKGNSLERQEQNAQAWCEKRGWKLFDSLNDLGLSAWTGANKKRGRLRELLEKLEAGDICEFRPKLDTDSRASWTVIPTEAGQRFQGKLDSPKS